MTAHPAQPIIDRILVDVGDLMTGLEAGDVTATAWQDEMAVTLARGHLAAFMAGQGSSMLDHASQQRVLADVTKQLSFLSNFTVEIQGAAEFQRGWNARAAMYAESVGASYFAGKFRMWPLPSVPRDGSTQCRVNCNCSIRTVELPGEGNVDIYWELGPSEHCQQCTERADQWNPLRIRDGELQQ